MPAAAQATDHISTKTMRRLFTSPAADLKTPINHKGVSMTSRKLKQRYAAELRTKATPAERRMYDMLKESGIRFDFQRPFDVGYKQSYSAEDGKFYIADFYLPTKGVIIELDGSAHNGRDTADIDRTKHLVKTHKMICGVLRYQNNEVFKSPESVMAEVESLKDMRLAPGIKPHKAQNKAYNQEVARRNEIRAISKTV